MKSFSLPENGIKALLFDMDCTLYTHDEYARTQVDLPVERLARLQGKTFEKMREEITAFQKNWAESHDGKKISLGNTFTHYGVSIEENIRWREELCKPEKYLVRDEALCQCLLQLARRFALAVVTNNPVSVAERTLSVLGAHDIFQKIVGLDTLCLSKPHEKIFKEAARLCNAPAEQCVSVGDRYDIDIALPLELGMGGILVDGVEDVYKLPDFLML